MDRSPAAIVFIAILVISMPAVTTAQTHVAGPVSGWWTADGNPYIATDILAVPEGETLVIEPGVEVRFQTTAPFVVHGTLIATGSPSDSVSFAPLEPEATWGGIQLLGAGEDCQFSHCVFVDALREGGPYDWVAGGAILSIDTSYLVANSRFDRCRVDGGDGARAGGGAIWCQGGQLRAMNNLFHACVASVFCTTGGGAIGLDEGDAIIRHNRFLGCAAHGMGGAIAGHASTLDIAHNEIRGCEGFHYGGGIGLRDGCDATIVDNLIVENTAADLFGGGIYLRDSNATIDWCTIAHNQAGQPGFGAGGGIYSQNTNGWAYWCIVWGNTAPEGSQIFGAAAAYSDVQGGYPGTENFDLDPLFASAPGGGGDYFLSCIDAGQAADSPCLDAGSGDIEDFPELLDRTTRTDLVADTGAPDLGYHRAADVSTQAAPTAVPFALAQNAPNPFNPMTVIAFELPTARTVNLAVYDVAGRHVATLASGTLGAGRHEMRWDGRDEAGRGVASGTYVYRLEAGDVRAVRRMTLVR